MVIHPRAHSYSRRIDVEEVLVGGGEEQLKEGLGYSLSDSRLHGVFLLKNT